MPGQKRRYGLKSLTPGCVFFSCRPSATYKCRESAELLRACLEMPQRSATAASAVTAAGGAGYVLRSEMSHARNMMGGRARPLICNSSRAGLP